MNRFDRGGGAGIAVASDYLEIVTPAAEAAARSSHERRKKVPAACIAAACLVVRRGQRPRRRRDRLERRGGDLVVQARLGTPPANRVLAIVQTAVHEAVIAAQLGQRGEGAATATDAAVAAANRATLAKLLPPAGSRHRRRLQDGRGQAGDSPAPPLASRRRTGRCAGAAWRADDGAGAGERYRPHAAAGTYVPTTAVAAPQWAQRKPCSWRMRRSFAPARRRPSQRAMGRATTTR
jgi:uncharacterized membrane protein